MPRMCYENHRFRDSTLSVITVANEIISEYMEQELDLTLRQVYYQLIARDLLPESWRDPISGTKNTEKNYGKLGSILANARLAGLLDWEAIVDRGRRSYSNSHWGSPQEIVETCAEQFQLDTRATQENYIEVWVEKEALLGVIESVCREQDVPFFACKGYVSVSAMWQGAQRFYTENRRGKQGIILHLGDHDPSGIDMTRDIQDRMDIFEADVDVQRIALNMDQIEELNPPPSPAKITDSRYETYRNEFGDDSWELDALDPRTIQNLINTSIIELTNQEKRNILLQEQQEGRDHLEMITNEWNNVIDFLEK